MLNVTNRQSEILTQRLAEKRLRSLRAVRPLSGMVVKSQGANLINFSSNDYLGLSQHPLLQERAQQFLERYGTGCGASRLVSGNLDCYEELESKLAILKGTEAALIMNSGFQTNLTVLSAITFDGSFILLDRLSHNSLLQGARLSQGKWSRFHHNDLQDLERRLLTTASQQAQERWIVSESVFGMDGDRADIDALMQLARKHDAHLFIDEAHSTGVFGTSGMGLAAGKAVDIIMGTFGKACGSFGSYVACSKDMKEYLINCCAGFIYSTGLPPAVLGAIDAALDLVPTLNNERFDLARKASFLRTKIAELGFSTANSSTQIIPVIIGDDVQAMSLSRHLEHCGILAMAIRPPTVPDGTARIRLSLSSAHSDAQIKQLIAALSTWNGIGDGYK